MAEAIINNTSFISGSGNSSTAITFKGHSSSSLSVSDRVFISPRYLADGVRKNGKWMEMSGDLICISSSQVTVYEYSASTNAIAKISTSTLSGSTGQIMDVFKLTDTILFMFSKDDDGLSENYYGSIFKYTPSSHTFSLVKTNYVADSMHNGGSMTGQTSYCAIDESTLAISTVSRNVSSITGTIVVIKLNSAKTSWTAIREDYISSSEYPDLMGGKLVSINGYLYSCNTENPYYIKIPSSTSGSLTFTRINNSWLRDIEDLYSEINSKYSYESYFGGPGEITVTKATASGSSISSSQFLNYQKFAFQDGCTVALNANGSLIVLITRSFEYDTSDYKDYFITLIDEKSSFVLINLWPYTISERYAFSYSGSLMSDRFIGNFMDLANLQKVDDYTGVILNPIGVVTKDLGNGYYEVSF